MFHFPKTKGRRFEEPLLRRSRNGLWPYHSPSISRSLCRVPGPKVCGLGLRVKSGVWNAQSPKDLIKVIWVPWKEQKIRFLLSQSPL